MSAIAIWLGKLLAGPLLEGILQVIRHARQQKLSQDELRTELEKIVRNIGRTNL